MSSTDQDTPRGYAFAVSAYFLWGFLPIYMKALSHVPPVEIVAHRIIWSLPVAALVLLVLRRTQDIVAALKSPRVLAMAAVTATLVSINWGIYVWAIVSDRALDAALGYYINPLFSVALGALVLRERLSAAQLLAVALAAVAVLVLTLQSSAVPWPALGLTVSWGLYALLKKELPIGPNQGFTLEALLLTPFALGYLLWLGPGNMFGGDWTTTLLLLGGGIVTAGPLMLYAHGAKGLRLSTIAILQYIAPTMIFLVAVLLFDEPFDTARKIAFPMIWAALVIYTWSSLRQRRVALRRPV